MKGREGKREERRGVKGKGNGSRQGEVREGKGSVNEKEKREREWIIGEEFEREESRVRNGREGEGTWETTSSCSSNTCWPPTMLSAN